MATGHAREQADDGTSRFTRERRDFLFANRDKLECDHGWVNSRRLPTFGSKAMCPAGDLCKDCEYALHLISWPPDEIERTSMRDDGLSGCLGWVDRMHATKSCCFCAFLVKLFLHHSPGFPVSNAACETNRRRFCIWLTPAGIASITATQSRADQLGWDCNIGVQEVSDYYLDTEPAYENSSYEGFQLHLSSVNLAIEVYGSHSAGAAVLNLSRDVPAYWNAALFRDALRACKERHGRICEGPVQALERWRLMASDTPSLPSSNLRFIDVRDWCVVDATSNMTYVALSYCWSKGPNTVLLKQNEAAFLVPGALKAQQLPFTVRDAIQAVHDLQECYLWIDSLCIIQDDDEDKMVQLAQMDSVYREASLTMVVAASTEGHPIEGIPGVSPCTARRPLSELTIRGWKFVQTPRDLWHAILQSRWHTRAWTFQEYLLSKRVLLFMPEQAYFLCEQASFEESMVDHVCMDHGVLHDQSLVPCCDLTLLEPSADAKKQSKPQNYHNTYEDLVESYTKRQLSFQSDALKAARGLLSLLAREHNIRFMCGLPVPHLLGYFATWCPNAAIVRREWLSGEPIIPSWSWAGWRGPVTFLGTNCRGSASDEGPRFTQVGIDAKFWSELDDWSVSAHGSEQTLQRIELEAMNLQEVLSIESCVLSFTAPIGNVTIAPWIEARPQLDQEATQTNYKMASVSIPQNRSSELLDLSYRLMVDDRRAGTVILHQPLRWDDISNEELITQFIALSEGDFYWSMRFPMSPEDEDDERNYRYEDDKGQTIEHPPFDELYWDIDAGIVNVLAVRFEDGIAYRIGIAQIHRDAWLAIETRSEKIRLG